MSTIRRFHLVWFLSVFVVCAQAAPIPAAPRLAVNASILVDFDSGRVLAEQDADKRMAPASITKVMTSYVIYQEMAKGKFNLQTMVPISEKAWRMEGSRMFVEVGKQVSVEDLLRGLVIQSGNDATVALAEFVAGTEDAFAEYMNHYAVELGLSNSHFMNSTGWPHEQHYMTARDIATMAAALIRDFPEHYQMYSQKEFRYNNIPQYNRNKLLWSDDTVDGVKTGHTEEAGFCLVSSAKRDGMRLIAVLLGAKTDNARAQESQALISYGFRFYETHRLYEANAVLSEPRLWQGASKQLPLGVERDLYVTIPRGDYSKLQASMAVPADLTAPVELHQVLGKVQVSLGDELVSETDLVALEAIPEGSWWQRWSDSVMQLFE